LKNRQYDLAIYDFTKALELTREGDKTMKFLMLRENRFKTYGTSLITYSKMNATGLTIRQILQRGILVI
jgi:hypothetical protein